MFPVQNIKAIALFIIQSGQIDDEVKTLARSTIRENYNTLVTALRENRLDTEAKRRWTQEFMAAFPNGEIVP